MNNRIYYCLIILFSFLQINAQSTASKNVKKFSIEAPQLDTIKKIWVYLPETYISSEKNYEVIYMHDAQNLFDRETSYVGEWKVDEALDSIAENEAIIVGIEHGGDKRIDELTPFPNEKYGGGKGNAYVDFIKYTLKPYIDATYRTKTEARNTTIFGSSLGGLISFYAALKYPGTFGNAGVYSPSFWFSDRIYEFTQNAELNKNGKFYFLAGTAESEETIPDLKKMLELLQNKGMDSNHLKVKYIEGGKHNEAMWSKYFPETYLWLLE